jgi:hypothetical protein
MVHLLLIETFKTLCRQINIKAAWLRDHCFAPDSGYAKVLIVIFGLGTSAGSNFGASCGLRADFAESSCGVFCRSRGFAKLGGPAQRLVGRSCSAEACRLSLAKPAGQSSGRSACFGTPIGLHFIIRFKHTPKQAENHIIFCVTLCF